MTVQGMPDVAPAYGSETARAIAKIIDLNPKLHNQSVFGMPTECGTQHCIAGWAWVLHKGEFQNSSLDHPDQPNVAGLERFGAEALDLDRDDALTLFYSLGNKSARKMLDVIANGGDLKAFYTEIFGE